jgi:hypothetical protein
MSPGAESLHPERRQPLATTGAQGAAAPGWHWGVHAYDLSHEGTNARMHECSSETGDLKRRRAEAQRLAGSRAPVFPGAWVLPLRRGSRARVRSGFDRAAARWRRSSEEQGLERASEIEAQPQGPQGRGFLGERGFREGLWAWVPDVVSVFAHTRGLYDCLRFGRT